MLKELRMTIFEGVIDGCKCLIVEYYIECLVEIVYNEQRSLLLCIFNAIVSSTSTGRGKLPSTCPPARTTVLEKEMRSNLDPAQQASTSFCRRQGLQTRFVRKNMDIFQWFLAKAPPEGDDHRPKKRRQYRKKGQGGPKKLS